MQDNMEASTLYTNGAIRTMDLECPLAEALAVDAAGRIIAVGTAAELKPFIGTTTTVIDLGGRFVMPGVFDFHLHVITGMTTRLRSFVIDAGDDFGTILARVRAAAAVKREGEWLTGSAYGARALADIQRAGLDAKRQLDEASGGRPTLLIHSSLHGAFANEAGLARAGIDAATPDPAGGRIVRIRGEATGLLEENAMWIVDAAIPVLRDSEMVDVAQAAMRYFNSVGVTGFVDAQSTPEMIDAFRALDDAEELSTWAGFTLSASRTCSTWSPGSEALLARRKEVCGPHMVAENAKIFLDGVPSLKTAAMIEPYPGTDGYGEMYLSPEELFAEIAAFDKQGVGVKVHAVGDAAIVRVLDAVERVRDENGDGGPWHHIAHGQYIPHREFSRMKRLRIVADLSPPMWFVNHASLAHERVVGKERYATVWPIRSMLEAGVNMALGSDWMTIFPELNPWQALAGLLTRRDPTGQFEGIHGPQEAVTLDQALPLMTRNSAKAIGLGDRTGRLAPGLSADFIVLDRDLYKISAAEIAGTLVLKTIFEGSEVYTASA
ncbi:amidohydrolase family protein [Sinorhizobium medicae]|nr:amidohydrolase family protein [Sinorhizobium medicae]MDX0444538.1 amidohydrolase family protein [Sinorhizobium medicae]MDX0489814.1 amidohydrolase family protein [Sinorhizobium medicae]MDX0523640.1 amidohydrolase family protein [Sinorhizobium medicae]MDX0539557.1 amidohydrolase family protein [Sinorhizobium medicae]